MGIHAYRQRRRDAVEAVAVAPQPHPAASAAERVGGVGRALCDEAEAVAAEPAAAATARGVSRLAAHVMHAVHAAHAARGVDAEDEACLEAVLRAGGS